MLSINNIKGNLQERYQNWSQADQENYQSKGGTRGLLVGDNGTEIKTDKRIHRVGTGGEISWG